MSGETKLICPGKILISPGTQFVPFLEGKCKTLIWFPSFCSLERLPTKMFIVCVYVIHPIT